MATSLKGHLGHTGASSGAMGVLAGITALTEGVLANTAGTTDVDPEVEFEVVTGTPTPVDAMVAQVNAFGFGGQDSSLVLGRGKR